VRFSLFGFPILVQPSFAITGVMLSVLAGQTDLASTLSWLLIVFVSVLWHELGHAFASRNLGLGARIELGAMGGMTYRESGTADPWWRDALISVAGPANGLLLGAAVFGVSHLVPRSAVTDELVRRALWANVGWSVINLLPILPYDGGNICWSIVRAITPSRAETVAQGVTIGVGTIAFAVAVQHRMIWAGYLAGSAAARAGGALLRIRDKRRLDRAWETLLAGDAPFAHASAADVLKRSRDDLNHATAIEICAWAELHEGRLVAARQSLDGLPRSYHPTALLEATLATLEGQDATAALQALDADLVEGSWLRLSRAWIEGGHLELVDRLAGETSAKGVARRTLHQIDALLFSRGHFTAAKAIAERAFAAHGDPEDAYNAACSLGRLGRPEEALSWLERAIDAGYRDAEHLAADEDLVSVRALPRFAAVAGRLAR
jgi:Zn-dependent protease